MLNNFTKNKIMFDEIVSKVHPDYKDLPKSVIKVLSERAKHFTMEYVVEEAVAHRHLELARTQKKKINFKHIPEGHLHDLSDMSDVKCATLTDYFDKSTGCDKYRAGITVKSSGGKLKIGALRVVLYNDILSQLEFYFFPKNVWRKWVTGGSSNFSLTSGADGIIKKIQEFRLKSFDDMCMMSEEKMKQRFPSLEQFF